MTRNNTKARNGQRRNARRSTKQQGTARWPWFVAGILCGVAVTVIVGIPSGFDQQSSQPAPEKVASKTETAKPRFDFYTLLRESEVIVSDTDEPAEDIPEQHQKQPVNNTQPSETYVLQVGSFKSVNDADSLRAGLLLLNLRASIEKVSPRPGETWHRVLVGPMQNRAEVNEARDKLASNKIDSLLLKRSQ